MSDEISSDQIESAIVALQRMKAGLAQERERTATIWIGSDDKSEVDQIDSEIAALDIAIESLTDTALFVAVLAAVKGTQP